MNLLINNIKTHQNFEGKKKKNTSDTYYGYSSKNERISSDVLFESFLRGERPYYTYNVQSDAEMQKLNDYADRYKECPTIKNKQVLLNHERKILYQELEHPELTLARNYKSIYPLFPKSTNADSIKNTLINFNLVGLARLESLSAPFETSHTKKKINMLNRIYDNTESTKTLSESIKYNAALTIDGLSITKGRTVSDTPEYTKSIIDLYKQINSYEALCYLLKHSNNNCKPEILEIVEDVLDSNPKNPEIRRIAVWGGGKYRSDKVFNIIKDIALDTNEKDIQLREFAIHSTSLYIKDKPEEVLEIMDKISHDGTVFEDLGKVLTERLTGHFHNERNREYKHLSKDEAKLFDKYKKTHLFYDKRLNRRKQNAIDSDLVFYKNRILSETSGTQTPIAIIEDTYTKIFKNEAGQRDFTQGIENNGAFLDSIEGAHTPQIIIIKNDLVADSFYVSSVGHEMGHKLMDMLPEKEKKEVHKLYTKAKKGGYTLGDYAGRNVDEYFAVGCDAFCSVYKPHKHLYNPDYGNTRYTLMTKDPDLYKFILKYLYKK